MAFRPASRAMLVGQLTNQRPPDMIARIRCKSREAPVPPLVASSDPPCIPAAIDPEVLDLEPMIRNFDGLGPVVRSLYVLFLKDEETLLDTLRTRLIGGDLQGARLTAHSAGGAARTAGATKVARLLASIEDALLRGDAEEARAGTAALPSALAEVRSNIARICSIIPL